LLLLLYICVLYPGALKKMISAIQDVNINRWVFRILEIYDFETISNNRWTFFLAQVSYKNSDYFVCKLIAYVYFYLKLSCLRKNGFFKYLHCV
jgi:hypothetical protein